MSIDLGIRYLQPRDLRHRFLLLWWPVSYNDLRRLVLGDIEKDAVYIEYHK